MACTVWGLRVERCEEVLRPVDAENGAREAIDVLVEAPQVWSRHSFGFEVAAGR